MKISAYALSALLGVALLSAPAHAVKVRYGTSESSKSSMATVSAAVVQPVQVRNLSLPLPHAKIPAAPVAVKLEEEPVIPMPPAEGRLAALIEHILNAEGISTTPEATAEDRQRQQIEEIMRSIAQTDEAAKSVPFRSVPIPVAKRLL